MQFLRWLRNIVQLRQAKYVDASQWADAWFTKELNDIARRVADILVVELNVQLDDLGPTTTFIDDLKMTDLEPFGVVTELENEFHISIPPEDGERLATIAALVQYLHSRMKTA